MNDDPDTALTTLRTRALQRLHGAGCVWQDDTPLLRLAQASDFAIDTLCAQPDLLTQLQTTAAAPLTMPLLDADNRAEWPRLLRRYRQAESTRLIWRDVIEGAAVDDILAGSTALADACLQSALTALEAEFAQRFGVVRDAQGQAQRLVVFGLGKLGGGELNFSSDVDLVYAYANEGQSDGARSLHAQDYFARLGQQLAKLLDEVTADGFCHRVDLRLRPFGNAGRVALSFAAMELYFQREGRDWERYAWQKARCVAGDIDAGEAFLSALRPFVYRRYLDYGALDGLRAMKAMIAAEVARKDMTDDIKRGPGGIREIEFLVQALQLIRGGRERELRERRLLPALRALVASGHVDVATGAMLEQAYRFLRTLENRIQMLADAQTHALPESLLARTRIACGLGYPDWPALDATLTAQRAQVAEEFAALLAPRQRVRDGKHNFSAYWHSLPEHADAAVLADAGFEAATELHASLCDVVRAPGVRDLSDTARARLDRVLPALLFAASTSAQPDAVLQRVLPLLHAVLRRTSYLALLDEQPAALQRLVDVLARSALLGERLAVYPLLLDELLDVRVSGQLPDAQAMQRECAAALRGNDTEAALDALNEVRQALSFRMALALLDARIDAQDCARRLAWLADAVVACTLQLAQDDMHAAHGDIAAGQFAVLGYGSLGGEELGFGSDLDLVFLFDAPTDAVSNGARPLDAPRWYARLGQKIVALLGARTSAGRLFDVDVRLRPDGAKGLLVSSLASFADYQRTRAWTWEHQALVRARGVAGTPALLATFEHLRSDVLASPREADRLREDVGKMRIKMRAELDRSDAVMFDLKQGAGGLVDLEFLLQWIVLRHSATQPALRTPRSSAALLYAAQVAGVLDADTHAALRTAHALLLDVGLRCTLDRRPRRAAYDAPIEAARAMIAAAVRAQGLQVSDCAAP
ncbi:MAG TPA: bifunctional [glutamate--ammonia ligase]-adenylyl-L-tyrosine phosphorylase/[glutamate--ammonia-ligase] adenylyltransferase [Thermomonas sp.]|jgi:glutamate-ammonia-ligase adenylyltransferase|uniref:bifunctional [glutamate--ammonia ligase]-adenylyl-L-tyrosine phosphorylase/[glutamate--ammonia-ligase] adenylyltransferase n=1 Tax=Thermomonas sp. TaxID=1971895 RepID=UPI002C0D61AA|nr:bifunctional [glutamate--ammonia ligase]-adenylyl-L-tyrosine phosphorylase/[glutamate--ammonia-ligase] adenylyltransferase [Thermomonas sp.]HOV96420.1 bifunctional [glutamate--ammonia ligase]-adenylyl-L-tyrosine phosphorylase/[glutamate--ammonia-ligase] adenylyltransferase [Thermomonas sp.]